MRDVPLDVIMHNIKSQPNHRPTTHAGMPEMRDVPLAVMERLEVVPGLWLKQLAADKDIFKDLPRSVQRQVRRTGRTSRTLRVDTPNTTKATRKPCA